MGDHTEAIQITFDPNVVSYDTLVDIFFDSHACSRPVGKKRQYISAIWYASEEQKAVAEAKKAAMGPQCTTEVAPAGPWYDAEEYHQKYIQKAKSKSRGSGGACAMW
ncbi:methionine sulfoxide reductase [Thecamonas trahens ATCC 50062]|uniref:peptide-methionine (S)-S-oxide reductase n=1 Tax=Thecamonas trahens ATCC 50062 TaxID=461836 RepID=A0A0L0DNN6_THETB|nr:methionine sulfoxide reductase [Thecamonas trahens ATCC 50062]KNC53924.1 methionine sulfoxide reductase [Thecamonas trahens ATCC 50062]|eukprot:XP_013754128.1 methionine sulfoxide reductase [Thecamonas trahens ATCC 50062]